MSKAETMLTLYGEMLDLINCLQIDEGRAEPKSVNNYTDMASALLIE